MGHKLVFFGLRSFRSEEFSVLESSISVHLKNARQNIKVGV